VVTVVGFVVVVGAFGFVVGTGTVVTTGATVVGATVEVGGRVVVSGVSVEEVSGTDATGVVTGDTGRVSSLAIGAGVEEQAARSRAVRGSRRSAREVFIPYTVPGATVAARATGRLWGPL
jgi:hypothetical protein